MGVTISYAYSLHPDFPRWEKVVEEAAARFPLALGARFESGPNQTLTSLIVVHADHLLYLAEDAMPYRSSAIFPFRENKRT